MKKILIIRFSSFGDVLQSLSIAGTIKSQWPDAEIHWATRSDFVPLIETHPAIIKVWSLSRKDGLSGLLRLAKALKREKFTHIYDAHNNLRSRILGMTLKASWPSLLGKQKFLRRPLYRFKRFLLFRFRYNTYQMPFNGQRDLLKPLEKWGLNYAAPSVPQIFLPDLTPRASSLLPFKEFICLSPSAAYPLKRWPLDHWKSLIAHFRDENFVVLGGPEDTFLEELVEKNGNRVVNTAGKLSLLESASIIARSKVLIANDTGLMHVAEQLGHPCVALMGPAPFGFPSRPSTKIMELDLWCRPCSKHGQGPCINPEFQKCLRDIHPEAVAREVAHKMDPSLQHR